jgi:hypothetical protein
MGLARPDLGHAGPTAAALRQVRRWARQEAGDLGREHGALVIILEFPGLRLRTGGLLVGDEMKEVVIGGCRQEKGDLFSGGVEMFWAKTQHRPCRCQQRWCAASFFFLETLVMELRLHPRWFRLSGRNPKLWVLGRTMAAATSLPPWRHHLGELAFNGGRVFLLLST